MVDTTGKLPDLLTGSLPEATRGVTASHVYALMLEVEQRALIHNLSLIGHCTDSASNALNALLKLATPSKHLIDHGIIFLGLQRKDYFLYALFLRSGFPSIAYACWDHSGRTVLRNLLNRERTIVAEVEVQPSTGKFKTLACQTTASVQDLCSLKQVHAPIIFR